MRPRGGPIWKGERESVCVCERERHRGLRLQDAVRRGVPGEREKARFVFLGEAGEWWMQGGRGEKRRWQ